MAAEMSGDRPDAFCPRFHHAIELIGRRWSGAILRAMLSGSARFSEIAATVPGLSDRLLSERLKELEERFHLLVEASDVGMIVVDEAGVILMSNTSAEKMLGYPAGGLQGLSVDNLLPPAQRSQHTRMRAGYLQHPEVRKMGAGRKLEALTADGRRIPVEVGLNPYLDHGKQVVLASIIDLSK